MGTAFLKGLYRDIVKLSGRFAGIFVIIALGVFVFAGLGFTGTLMRNIGDKYFTERNFMDIRVLSTYGISERDLAAIADTPGVLAAEGAHTADAVASTRYEEYIVKVHGIHIGETRNSRINTPILLSGRYPDKPAEMLVEPDFLTGMGVKIGDTVELLGGTDSDIRNTLKNNRYRIVGVAESPLYFAAMRGSSSIGGGSVDYYVLIPDENFKSKIYAEAHVTVKDAAVLYAYGDEYKDLVESVIESVEAVGDLRIPARKAEATRGAYRLIAAAEDELAAAKTRAYSELDDGLAEIASAENTLSKSKLELISAEQEIANAEAAIKSGENEIHAGLLEIDAALSAISVSELALIDSYSELSDARLELERAERELVSGRIEISEGIDEIKDGMRQIASALGKISDGKALLEGGIAQLSGQIAELEFAIELIEDPEEAAVLGAQLAYMYGELDILKTRLSELESTEKTLNWQMTLLSDMWDDLEQMIDDLAGPRSELAAGWMELESGYYEADSGFFALSSAKSALLVTKAELESSLAELTVSKRELDQSRLEINRLSLFEAGRTLDQAERDYAFSRFEALASLESAEADLAASKAALDQLDDPKWYVLGRESNSGYASYSSDADTLHDIGTIIPLLFFLVSALVSLTTMTRLVEEQRTAMGTLKALGYSSSRIRAKYILYSAAPTLLGSAIGGYGGLLIFPEVIVKGAFGGLYSLPTFETEISLTYWLGGTVLAALSTTLTTLSICNGALAEHPASLMRPKTPKAGRKTILEHVGFLWRRMSFIYKVTFRNISRYKLRLFMTLAGVGGCTALLLLGFALKEANGGIMEKQFGELRKYDMKVAFSDSSTEAAVKNAEKVAAAHPAYAGGLQMRSEYIDIHSGDGDTRTTTLIVPSDTDIGSLVVLRERVGGKSLSLEKNGVIVSEKTADILGLSPGDEIVFRDGDDLEYTAVVSGICETYLISTVYMNADYYAEIFGEKYKPNAIYAALSPTADDSDVGGLADLLLGRSGVSAVTFTAEDMKTVSGMLSGVDIAVYLILVVAAILAFVVLLNLTNINLSERTREIATIEVLGFHDGEVAAYIYRENLIVSFAASLLGLVMGKYLHLYICLSIERGDFMFVRGISPLSYIFSVGITMIFSIIVALMTSGKLKKINMIEALKSTE